MTLLVKPITGLLGLVLLIIGIAGFFTDGMLWLFEVDTVHNIVHIVSGLVALAVMKNYTYARLYLILFGLVYGAVGVVGLVNGGDIVGLFSVNSADNWLHFGIAAVCLVVGFGSKSRG